MTDDQTMLDMARISRALGDRDLRILVLEETIAQMAARIAELEKPPKFVPDTIVSRRITVDSPDQEASTVYTRAPGIAVPSGQEEAAG